jgi:hypothetical protein
VLSKQTLARVLQFMFLLQFPLLFLMERRASAATSPTAVCCVLSKQTLAGALQFMFLL